MGIKSPNPMRTEASGLAYKGSQRQIQRYVQEQPTKLNEAIINNIPSLAKLKPELSWVSPLITEKYAEYSDQEFLKALGLAEKWPALNQFWPWGGPVWDALAKVRWKGGEGVILLEAKSYPEECKSACQAGAKSLATIQAAIRQTQEFFSASPTPAWLNDYYQLANRLAHLYFFRKVGINAWLVLLLFTNDWKPTSQEQWEREFSNIWTRLGLPAKHEWIGQVFMEVSK